MADWHSPAGHSQDTGAREKSDTNQSDSGHGARRAALALVTDSGRRDADKWTQWTLPSPDHEEEHRIRISRFINFNNNGIEFNFELGMSHGPSP